MDNGELGHPPHAAVNASPQPPEFVTTQLQQMEVQTVKASVHTPLPALVEYVQV